MHRLKRRFLPKACEPYLDHKLQFPHSLVAACHIGKCDACAAVPAGLPLALRKLYGLDLDRLASAS